MAAESFGEEFRDEMARKAIAWGPAIAGALVLGPAGIALGFLTTIALVASGGKGSPSPRDGGDRGK
jgi:hypothetical protein